MRRLTRLLFHLAAGAMVLLSLVVCAAVVALWARTVGGQDTIQYQGREWNVSVQTERGSIGLLARRQTAGHRGWAVGRDPVGYHAPMGGLFRALYDGKSLGGGFVYVVRPGMYVLVAPPWFWLAVALLPPALSLRRLAAGAVARLRRQVGRCPR